MALKKGFKNLVATKGDGSKMLAEQEAKKESALELYKKRYLKVVKGNDTVLVCEDPETLDPILFPIRLIEPYDFKITFIDSEKEWDIFFTKLAEIEPTVEWAKHIGSMRGAGGLTVMRDSYIFNTRLIVIGHKLERSDLNFMLRVITHEITHATLNIMVMTDAYEGYPHSQEPVCYLQDYIMGLFLDHLYVSKGITLKLEKEVKEVKEVEGKQQTDIGVF